MMMKTFTTTKTATTNGWAAAAGVADAATAFPTAAVAAAAVAAPSAAVAAVI